MKQHRLASVWRGGLSLWIPSDAVVHVRLGHALYFHGDLEGCILKCEEALSLDANCAATYVLMGSALVFTGRLEEGRTSVQNWLRLDPLDPNRATRFLEFAVSHYFERNYEQAAQICRQAMRQYPNHAPSYRFLLASLGQLGRLEEGEALMKIAPVGYDHYARHRPPWFGLKDQEHMLEGMRKAGWCECAVLVTLVTSSTPAKMNELFAQLLLAMLALTPC